MPDLPSSLSLTTIADGSPRIASPVRNNFSSIQAAVNALKDALANGTASQVLVATDADTIGWGGDFGTYVPTWTSTGSAPALGNGTLTGRYVRIGKLVYCEARLVAGTTTSFGTGSYRISLPVTASASAAERQSGNGIGVDASSGFVYGGFILLTSTSTATIYFSGSPLTEWAATVPVAWATSDDMRLAFVYEAA